MLRWKKINGVELSKRIREKNSDIQIIFISGYPEYIGYGYDVGNKLGFVKATVDFALHDEKIKDELLEFLREK